MRGDFVLMSEIEVVPCPKCEANRTTVEVLRGRLYFNQYPLQSPKRLFYLQPGCFFRTWEDPIIGSTANGDSA
ncbi:hypothetical protein KSD_55090 [Ktedonobacter sp. SOSP1-85]|nr:hypothetical protein KSD_55090 [Ktedonobacter sp. SOSP1-85]